LTTKTKNEKTTINHRDHQSCEKSNCEPRKTKKSIIKKSLNGFILLSISNLYGNDAIVNQAINAPISNENPNASIAAAAKRHRANAKMRRNSCDLATCFIIHGRIYVVRVKLTITTTTILSNKSETNDHRAIATPADGKDAKIINVIIAMISWTIKTHREILP